jgi:hypothetical protein
LSYTFEKRIGLGCTIGWCSSGSTSPIVVLGTVVDGDKTEAKAKTANTSILSDVWETFSKASIDPGEFKFTVVYDPLASDYQNLATSLAQVNALPPYWQLSFPDNGSGSGSTTEEFYGHVVAMSREIKKNDFLMTEVTLKLTGNAGLTT